MGTLSIPSSLVAPRMDFKVRCSQMEAQREAEAPLEKESQGGTTGAGLKGQGATIVLPSSPKPPHPKAIWILFQESNIPSHHILTLKGPPARRPRPNRGQAKNRKEEKKKRKREKERGKRGTGTRRFSEQFPFSSVLSV